MIWDLRNITRQTKLKEDQLGFWTKFSIEKKFSILVVKENYRFLVIEGKNFWDCLHLDLNIYVISIQ